MSQISEEWPEWLGVQKGLQTIVELEINKRLDLAINTLKGIKREKEVADIEIEQDAFPQYAIYCEECKAELVLMAHKSIKGFYTINYCPVCGAKKDSNTKIVSKL